MAQCDHCMEMIDEGADTHVKIVKPMEFKGQTQQITQFYCSVGCLVEKMQEDGD